MLNKCKQTSLLIALLVAFVAALYGQFLWSPTFFDDGQFFKLDEDGRPHVLQYAIEFSPLVLRSLPYATLAWTAQLFGYDLIGFRIGNLLLHAATVVALFFFLLQLFEVVLAKVSSRSDGLKLRWAAFFAALLFGLHPVAVFAVGYLTQRTIVMATLFSLLAMYAYVRGNVQKKQGWLWASVFFYYWAVYSKEHVVMLPAVMLALTVLLHEDWFARLKRMWSIFAAFAAIALLVILAKKGVLGGVYEINAPDMLQEISPKDAYPFSVLTQSWLFFKYFALWILPNPEWMSVDMREPFAKSYFSFYSLAFAAFIVYGMVAVYLLFKRGMMGLLGFALLFPWLMFMTEISTVRVQESFVLYRSYIWAAGGVAILPVLFWRATARGAILMLSIIAMFMFGVAMERLSTFSHPVLVWDDAEKLVKGRSDLPGVFRIYYNRGSRYLQINEYDKAIGDLKRSIELFPPQPYAYNNLGLAYFKKGELEEAVRFYSIAIEMNKTSSDVEAPRYYYGRAIAYEKQKNWAAASEDYKVTCKLAGKGCDKINLPLVGTLPEH
ncbi:MAG: tetratricopeptide repeat protein [Gallionella sp.]|jgi:hypothetical protein|nr:tetratricopeptide repeat protein [Gallionella sp.]MCK9354976.1 tetratricopeptide repeat protein [Gallionella sp.]